MVCRSSSAEGLFSFQLEKINKGFPNECRERLMKMVLEYLLWVYIVVSFSGKGNGIIPFLVFESNHIHPFRTQVFLKNFCL